jgi:hypothetical protein
MKIIALQMEMLAPNGSHYHIGERYTLTELREVMKRLRKEEKKVAPIFVWVLKEAMDIFDTDYAPKGFQLINLAISSPKDND